MTNNYLLHDLAMTVEESMSTAKLWLDLISTSFPICQLPSSRIEGDYNEPRRTATASNNGSGRGSYDKLGFGSSSNIKAC